MGFISGEFLDHSRMVIPLHSRNVLVLLFSVLAWLETKHKDISVLWDHYAFTCYFNIKNNITLVFCTIHSDNVVDC